MSFKPSVLILEKSSYPSHTALEECERLEKTADQKNAIVRFQRPKATSKFEKFVQFFSDLLHGVTKAKGQLLNRTDIPSVVHVRGISCERQVIAEAGRHKIYLSTNHSEHDIKDIEFDKLVVEVRDDPEIKNLRQQTLFRSMRKQLKERFEVYGLMTDRPALNTFLQLAERGKTPETIKEIQQLRQFSDVLAKEKPAVFFELTEDVKESVTSILRDIQEKIRQTKTSSHTDTSLFPDFTFSLLIKQGQAGSRVFRPPPSDSPPSLERDVPQMTISTPDPIHKLPEPSPPVITTPDPLPAQSMESVSGSPAATITPPPPPTAMLNKRRENVSTNGNPYADPITDERLADALSKLKPAALREAAPRPSTSPSDSMLDVLLNDPRFKGLSKANINNENKPKDNEEEWQ